jgi:Mrp family chromosome partitioning ATPase
LEKVPQEQFMSRNFELLQQASKFHELSPTAEGEPIPLVEATDDASTPVLEATGMARDEITKLVNRLFLIPGTEAPRSVVFTGTEIGNGCTWLCARLGELLASLVRGSVCLLDCNLRSPGLHQQFGVQNHHGLSEALTQTEGIRRYLRPLSRPNLWLLSCGSPVDNREALLGSDRMGMRLQELRDEFDYVIVDAGPLGAGTGGIVLGSLAEGVVLVLKANSSRRDTARKAMEDFQRAKVPILGVVLNRRTFPIPEAIYKHL